LDFLGDREIKTAAEEIRRVLRSGGKLLATYLAPPRNVLERLSSSFFTRFRSLSGGVRIVEVGPVLKELRFEKVESIYCSQKGVPIGLAYAKK
jgi:ubiquinone/menaquinone biosynthesis C-methylase UbiE